MIVIGKALDGDHGFHITDHRTHRDIAAKCIASGVTIALPIVTQPGEPLEFWRWQPGMAIRHDRAKIPIPAQREPVTPETLLLPLLGFDAKCYRLSYGGGYYDRTLAAMASKPFCIGLAMRVASSRRSIRNRTTAPWMWSSPAGRYFGDPSSCADAWSIHWSGAVPVPAEVMGARSFVASVGCP